MKIAVVGSGYVGLVAGTCFAESGHEVTCVDKDPRKIEALQRGEIPIYEPGLEELVTRNSAAGRLKFTTQYKDAIPTAQVAFIAVGTPEGESGDADLQYVLDAADQIGKHMTAYTVVVNKSTVPVGTADKVRAVLAKATKHAFDVVSNPEFLKEGAAIDDFLKPDRVVIGADSERARQIMGELYAPFLRTEHPVIYMDTRSAELTKYASNAMLATRISFMNDIAALCERVGGDVDQVRRGMGADRRIGYPFLFPGVGYGGSCFPKDVKALVATARDHGLELDLLRAVERTNQQMKQSLLKKAQKVYKSLEGKTFGVWGLAFKPNTDDMREAPSIEMVEGLLGKGARVQVHDPVAFHTAKRVFGDRVLYAPDPYTAIEGTDGLFLLTEWNEYRNPDLARMKALMRGHVVFDGRNIYDPEAVRAAGFEYFGIGRGHRPEPK